MVPRLLHLSLPSLGAFLAAIPLKHISFKVSLLESYISQGNGTSGSNKRPTVTSMAPAPRAKPKFGWKDIVEEAPMSPAASTGLPGKQPYPLPVLDHLLKLLSSSLPQRAMAQSCDSSPPPQAAAFATRLALAKFHLVSALFTLHFSHSGLTDPQWPTVVREGKFRACVLDGFSIQEQVYPKDDMAIENMTRQMMDCDGQTIKRYLASALEIISLFPI